MGQPQTLRQLMATSPQPAWCWVGRPRGIQRRICRKKNCVQPDTHPKAHRWPQGPGSLGTWVGPATSLPRGPFGESPQPSSPSLALPTTPMFVPQALQAVPRANPALAVLPRLHLRPVPHARHGRGVLCPGALRCPLCLPWCLRRLAGTDQLHVPCVSAPSPSLWAVAFKRMGAVCDQWVGLGGQGGLLGGGGGLVPGWRAFVS